MTTEHKGIEFFVGLFLLLGFGVLATMVVIFGRFSEGMSKFYPIIVEFPNASGLIKGGDVLLSGAKVGSVADSPRLTGSNYAVAVQLNIKDRVEIPRTSTFLVRISGLLGDAYVDIVPPTKYTTADFAKPGEIIVGEKVGGFDELSAKGGELVDKLNGEILDKLSKNLDEIKTATGNLNTKLLTEKNMKNVEETFENLKQVTDGFAKTSKDLDGVMSKAQEAIDAVKITMKTADASAAELKLALGDLRKMADSATKTVDSTKLLINKASSGDGTFGVLMSDKQMAADLKALIANMRRSGPVFYKDRGGLQATPAPAPQAPKTRR
ncbi:MAG: MlaD family protein [Chthoniobacteraceae bacterium]